MGQKPNLTKAHEEQVIMLAATGISQGAVGEQLGISRPMVNKIINRDDNRERIEKETIKYLEALPDVTDQIKRDISTANTLSQIVAGERPIEDLPEFFQKMKGGSSEALKYLEQQYKKQNDLLKATGILPSHAPSVFVQNLIQNNTTNVISPNVLEALGKIHNAEMEDFIDVEFE